MRFEMKNKEKSEDEMENVKKMDEIIEKYALQYRIVNGSRSLVTDIKPENNDAWYIKNHKVEIIDRICCVAQEKARIRDEKREKEFDEFFKNHPEIRRPSLYDHCCGDKNAEKEAEKEFLHSRGLDL
jgi:hypothetical protein